MNLNKKFYILIHYHEISLKGRNRVIFEKKFIQNIKKHIRGLNYNNIKLFVARVLISGVDLCDWKFFISKLKNVMGMSTAHLVVKTNLEFDSINNTALSLVENADFKTFRISTKRQNKLFKYTSVKINQKIGHTIQSALNKKVNLNNPDLNLKIEIVNNNAFIGYKSIMGYGGLPTASNENAISLLSSGIDSPVASFEMIKRGVNLFYLHFHSVPATNVQSINNVKKIATKLSEYQINLDLYLAPLLDIQQKIMDKSPSKYWIIFFRRSMLKISNLLALETNSKALVTGDNVGQVASQTLSNLLCISDAINIPILRPLAGLNKIDIINRAQTIGTYDISIKPYQDCCSFFIPDNPAIHAKLNIIKKIEKNLDLDDLESKCFEKMEKIHIGIS